MYYQFFVCSLRLSIVSSPAVWCFEEAKSELIPQTLLLFAILREHSVNSGNEALKNNLDTVRYLPSPTLSFLAQICPILVLHNDKSNNIKSEVVN